MKYFSNKETNPETSEDSEAHLTDMEGEVNEATILDDESTLVHTNVTENNQIQVEQNARIVNKDGNRPVIPTDPLNRVPNSSNFTYAGVPHQLPMIPPFPTTQNSVAVGQCSLLTSSASAHEQPIIPLQHNIMDRIPKKPHSDAVGTFSVLTEKILDDVKGIKNQADKYVALEKKFNKLNETMKTFCVRENIERPSVANSTKIKCGREVIDLTSMEFDDLNG